MQTQEAYTARELRTVAFVPLSPYRLGWEDANYQNIYDNQYERGSVAYWQYNDGHRDGIDERIAREAVLA